MKNYSILFPYAFAFYYVLNFFSVNPVILSGATFAKAVFFFLTIALLVHVITWLFFKDMTKASIGTLFFIVLFFSYILLEQISLSIIGPVIPRNIAQILIAFLIITFLGFVLYWLKRTESDLKAMTSFLSVFIVVLIVMPTYSLFQYTLAVREASGASIVKDLPPKAVNEQLPNIYHIVLDGYGRADVLKDYYNLDNSDFTGYLEENGFTVRDDCHTNYIWTQCSVASMLSMDYLQESNLNFNLIGSLLLSKLKSEGAGTILTEYGYRYIELSSPIPTQENSDIMGLYKKETNVFSHLLNRLPVKYFFNSALIRTDSQIYDAWRQQILNTFKKLEAIPDSYSGPTYVYCHFLMPHPPFVFDSQGEPVNPTRAFSINDCSDFLKAGGTIEEYRANYPEQLLFSNQMLKQAIDKISSATNRPTLIIISSDHGPRLLVDQESQEASQLHEALPIFLAYKLPDGDNLNLSEIKSPVNLYRAIINHYCGANYTMLSDHCYYSPWRNQLQFIDITDKINTGEVLK